jgi:hypothetical protein
MGYRERDETMGRVSNTQNDFGKIRFTQLDETFIPHRYPGSERLQVGVSGVQGITADVGATNTFDPGLMDVKFYVDVEGTATQAGTLRVRMSATELGLPDLDDRGDFVPIPLEEEVERPGTHEYLLDKVFEYDIPVTVGMTATQIEAAIAEHIQASGSVVYMDRMRGEPEKLHTINDSAIWRPSHEQVTIHFRHSTQPVEE